MTLFNNAPRKGHTAELVISRCRLWFKKIRVRKITKNGDVFYEYQGQHYPAYLNEGNACSFIAKKASLYCRGKGIDIGADSWPLPGAIPITNERTRNAYQLDDFKDASLDYVFSSHCLEHLQTWQDALRLWIRKLKTHGILFLYLPHESMKLWNPGEPWGRFGHKWIPTHECLNAFLSQNGMKIIEYSPQRDRYWSFHIVAEKL